MPAVRNPGARVGALGIVVGALAVCGALATAARPAAPGAEPAPAWTRADLGPPMSAAEARALMKRLARYLQENHLKRRADSPQRGMLYEYLDVARKGQEDQFVQGEALDTMHDGAWAAAALVNAYRATGDPFYRAFLVEWLLPFYCRMLNHSDTLFSTEPSHVRPGAAPWGREWALQAGEKGFAPYWWDDGGSVSLERRRDGNPLPIRPSFDFFVATGRPNPKFLLHGYSQGSSNHMAQDLAVMLLEGWLLLRDASSDGDRRLAAETAEAARNLHQCRINHHGHIPMCCAPVALVARDADELRRLPDPDAAALWDPENHCTRALLTFQPGERRPFPGFADDQEYRYYFGIVRGGGRLARALAFKTIYDAFTEPLLYRYYSDDVRTPAGINRFDLHPYFAVDGKPADYRSERKGPGGGPRPIGSRMGPQNMVCCGWALQALKAYPGIWDERYRTRFPTDLRVFIAGTAPDGRLLEAPWAEWRHGAVRLALRSTREALELRGECSRRGTSLHVYSRPNGEGSHAVLTVSTEGRLSARNDRGETLEARSEVQADGERLRFRVTLPYTVARTQKAWMNGIEHGRYSIRIAEPEGAAVRNFYLASREEDVRAWLEHELGGGLRTWQAIFDEKGFIPTGMGTGAFWDGYSDSGGYAHLISAAAQWVLYLEGKKDWEAHRIPTAG